MKKLLTVGLISLSFVSTSVFADTFLYQTSKHNIRVTCPRMEHTRYERVENCTYQSWNKPKQVGQGKPDLEIKNGEFRRRNQNTNCSYADYWFEKDNTSIVILVGLTNINDSECFSKKPPKNINGELIIYINDEPKSRYWLYEK